jgi:uncharacterized protein with ATP-grasp and redox domains
MVDMLHEQVMKPSDASCETFMGPREETFMENHSIFLKTDIGSISMSNTIVESIADVHIRKVPIAHSIPIAMDNLLQSTGKVSEIHQAAAVTTGRMIITLILIRPAQLC